MYTLLYRTNKTGGPRFPRLITVGVVVVNLSDLGVSRLAGRRGQIWLYWRRFDCNGRI